MRLLITGSSGLLGVNLALQAARSHEVFGTSRRLLTGAPFENIQADLLEPGAVGHVLDAASPDALIHCAAAADLEYCEQHPMVARRINAEVAGQVAAACLARDIRMIHISTDAVFDGEKESPYSESDEPRPLGVYANTKYAGELAVLGANPSAIVARVNFYGWSVGGRRSLAEFFVRNLAEGSAVRGFTDVTFCPTFVNDLSDALMSLLKTDLGGVYHVLGAKAMTKFDFGVAIARQFGYDERLISPVTVEEFGLEAKRSHYLGLSSRKLSTNSGISLPDFSTGLEDFHRQYLDGFPQKIRSYQQAAYAADARGPDSGQEPWRYAS